jgi:asparagine N-glycosylation enzyme membrane subunit Stt3
LLLLLFYTNVAVSAAAGCSLPGSAAEDLPWLLLPVLVMLLLLLLLSTAA